MGYIISVRLQKKNHLNEHCTGAGEYRKPLTPPPPKKLPPKCLGDSIGTFFCPTSPDTFTINSRLRMSVNGYVCVYVFIVISFLKAESFLRFIFISTPNLILTSAQRAFLLLHLYHGC